jgi:glycosyltransferase involved in cell wall biosynthesis|tara:strand:+ start:5098 stop:5763 length:666 start_codon:yes stop_codon:yes gene_type:complete
MSNALIILTLNEIDGVKNILPKIKREWIDEIIVVDGGSTDGTIEKAKEFGFKVIIQSVKGHGGAILTGIKNTTAEKIIIFGPDGNHEVDEIPRLIEKMNQGYDQVVISRFGKGSINLDAGKIDTFGNKMFTFLANLFFNGNLTDTLNESRIITREAFNQLKFDAMQLDSTYQMSIRGLKLKQRYFEIVGNEGERIGGKRKMRPFHTGCLLMKRLIKEILER